MRVAIISDLHANFHATQAVAEDILRQSVEETWCLGDVVGYGGMPRETLAWVEKHTTVRLQGNHDYAVATGEVSLFNPIAKEAALHHRDLLSASELAVLASWEPVATRKTPEATLLLCHGSPDQPLWEYVPASSAPAGLQRWRSLAEVIFMGHTHQPYSAQTPSGLWRSRGFLHTIVGGTPGGDPLLLVNPGSVGQPRDGDARASYAIVDTTSRAVELHRVAYDVDAAARAVEAAGLPEILGARLFRGL